MRFDNSIPLYYQIENILRERIAAGEYLPGTPFPTEGELIAEFAVSRITVRTALATLAEDGLILRQRGKGTTVTDSVQQTSPTRLSGFIEDILAIGQSTQVKVLTFRFMKAPAPAMTALELKPNQRPLRVEKIRFIDNEPFSHVLNYVPPEIGRKLQRKDTEELPLLHILENKLGIKIESGRQEVTATIAAPRLASFLNTMVGAPLLKCERIVYDVNHRPVEYVLVNYRADRYSYSVNLKRLSSHMPGDGQWRMG
jgi:GntR family transcriptional regulator